MRHDDYLYDIDDILVAVVVVVNDDDDDDYKLFCR